MLKRSFTYKICSEYVAIHIYVVGEDQCPQSAWILVNSSPYVARKSFSEKIDQDFRANTTAQCFLLGFLLKIAISY